jgi:predicted house-cleaning noncanonical NTP pyrophosphatase (MazG superfamily)
MKVYKRLVRDKVPDMILRDNQLPVTRTLNDKEYEEELNKKLEEEVKDYLVNKNYIDMIDIVEVIDAILDFKGIDKDAFEKERINKANKKGTFKDRTYLEKIMEQTD